MVPDPVCATGVARAVNRHLDTCPYMDKSEPTTVPAQPAAAHTMSTTTSTGGVTVTTGWSDQLRIVAGHDFDRCDGCQRILGIDDLEVVLGESRNTLYKRSKIGRDQFPKRLNRRLIAVLCRDAKTYLDGEVQR